MNQPTLALSELMVIRLNAISRWVPVSAETPKRLIKRISHHTLGCNQDGETQIHAFFVCGKGWGAIKSDLANWEFWENLLGAGLQNPTATLRLSRIFAIPGFVEVIAWEVGSEKTGSRRRPFGTTLGDNLALGRVPVMSR